MSNAGANADTGVSAGAAQGGEHDWLEDVTSERNLNWVRSQNADVLERLGDPTESPLYGRLLGILDSKEKIPYVPPTTPPRDTFAWASCNLLFGQRRSI